MTLETTENIAGKFVGNYKDPTEFVAYQDPHDELNKIEAWLIEQPQVDCPLKHSFTPNMYIREIFMPAGSLVTSALHLTTHPFFILKGDVSVWYYDCPIERYKAPYSGVTKAGTRRLLYTHEDTIWVTCHATTLTDVDEILKTIVTTSMNPYVEENDLRWGLWDKNKIKELQ
jgi:hypothetical protein